MIRTRRLSWLSFLIGLAGIGCSSPSQRSSEPAAGKTVEALSTAPPTTMDLSKYARVARYDLPEPTRTTPPDATSLLAQEASSVTYDWDTDTLFVVGDGGTSVVQVSKTGALIDSMTLAAGSSPQGTEFYDTEGIAYVGGGTFVLIEERYRQANLFTYAAGTTLNRADVQTVKLGTSIGNIGLEGGTYDPASADYLFVKEKDPRSIFETGIDFAGGTATNGSPTTDESTDLFDPSSVSTLDFSDIFALSNLPSLAGDPTFDQLLIISQESGQIVQVDRAGNVQHTMTIVADPGDTLSVPDMTMEGVTMDRNGNLYVVNEDGGGAVLVDHVQVTVAVHRDTFHRRVGNGKRVAGVGDDGHGVLRVAGAIDLNNMPGLLTDNQELVGGGVSGEWGKLKRKDVGKSSVLTDDGSKR